MTTSLFRHASILALALLISTGGCAFSKPDAYRDIHAAARDGNAAEVASDLDRQPGDLGLPDNAGLTPLHLAAAYDHTNVIMLLLDRGAKIDCLANDGAMPLHLAAQEGCTNAVSLLLARGASVNARDRQNRTPLARAEQWHADATASLLRQKGGTE